MQTSSTAGRRVINHGGVEWRLAVLYHFAWAVLPAIGTAHHSATTRPITIPSLRSVPGHVLTGCARTVGILPFGALRRLARRQPWWGVVGALSVLFGVAACGSDTARDGGSPQPGAVVSDVTSTRVTSGRRLALVVGNDAYASQGALFNAVNDARAVSSALEAVGFTVETVEDATRSRLTSALGSFASSLRSDDVALFYFAGHGMQVDEVNYLIPTDYAGRTEEELRLNAVSAADVQELLLRARVAMLVLDACRNNPYGGNRSAGAGLAPMEPRGTLIAYAAGAGEEAADAVGPGSENGLFTAKFVEALQEPGLGASALFRRVRQEVYSASNEAQFPAVYDGLLVDFVFREAAVESTAEAVELAATGGPSRDEASDGTSAAVLTQETAFWDSIRESTNPADFEAYKRRFPQGTFVELADNRLAVLRETPVSDIPPPRPAVRDPESPAAVEAALGLDLAARRRVQQGLVAAGFASGAADGVFGPATRAAIRGWQARRGVVQTGYLDGPAAVALVAAAADASVGDPPRPASPQLRDGERFRDCPTCPEMVVVPAGRFRMGCVSGRNCSPVHDVRVSSFALGVYEVTFEEYERFARATGRNRPNDGRWGRGGRPVIYVSWEDAQAYAAWLSDETGEDYRLPSESEWEYAARAGTTTRYSWGQDIGRNRANCDGCGSRWDDDQTAPAGSFAPNAWGVHDMHGNVSEWVADCWHRNYARAPRDGSAWTSGGDCGRRVLRGGSWGHDPVYLHSAIRRRDLVGARFDTLGFRVSRTLD